MNLKNEDQLMKNYQAVRVCNGVRILWKGFPNKKYSYINLICNEKKNGKDLSLQRSVRILQSLSHKCILKFVKYIITKDDSIYLFFEPCKKGSLQRLKPILINSKQKELIDLILFQIVEGLKYLKSVCVAHRDLKPSNIAFTSEGELKIIDFDQAVCFTHANIDQESKLPQFPEIEGHPIYVSRRSRAMSFVGTALYMSPQMKCKTKTDQRGDTWALGCIIYELLMNQSLFIDFEQEKQLKQEITSNINRMKNEKVQQGYIKLLERILAINPSQRISIDQVYSHKIFEKLRKNREFYDYSKQRLKKFLRGNYSILNPKTLTDALTVDLIGMKAGQQVFQKLQTAVFLNQKYHYDVRHLIGGAQYFKLRDIKEQKQIYLIKKLKKVYLL